MIECAEKEFEFLDQECPIDDTLHAEDPNDQEELHAEENKYVELDDLNLEKEMDLEDLKMDEGEELDTFENPAARDVVNPFEHCDCKGEVLDTFENSAACDDPDVNPFAAKNQELETALLQTLPQCEEEQPKFPSV